jgi:hypothetical protein
MRFRIQDDVLAAFLHDESRDDAPTSAGTVRFSDLLEKIKDAAEPGWWYVRVVTPGAREHPEGFIRSIQLTEAEQTEAETIDEEAFFRQIAYAAVRLCANRDYLFAVAFAASGLRNIASGESSAVGPFQFMPETWNELVKYNGEENDITPDDITDPGSQAVFAAVLSLDAQSHLNERLGRMPTVAQLYCAHLFGIDAAASVLRSDPQTPIVKALRDFYRDKPQGGEFADKILKSNSALLTGKTVDQVLDAVVDPLSAGLERAAALAAKLGLQPQVPGSPASDGGLKAALRAAVRRNEIEDDTPYKLSFAEKGESGGSFGFMQGDLAANQPEVKAAFRRALSAANIPDAQISSLIQSLSVHLTENPLSEADFKLVNDALDAPEGRALVDAMDEQIFADVCKKLDKCIDVAGASGKTIDPKAQIYMLLWINMSGPPTTLLDWLSGKDVTMAKSVPAPGATVDGTEVEDFLRATKYFSENDRVLQHIIESAAAGARLLGTAAGASLLASTPSTGAVRLSPNPGIDLEETESIKQLVAIAGEASKTLPDGFRVTVTSAMRKGATVAGTGGRSQHANGNAIDIAIINSRGQVIPNRGADYTGLYKRLAIAAFRANERMFPGRAGRLAWGGNFTVGPADGDRDLMHFDYGNDRGRFGNLAQEAATATV